MARILKLTLLEPAGDRVLVNTANITSVHEHGEIRSIYFNDANDISVTDPFDAIEKAWKHGDNQGQTEVFEDAKV